MSELEPLIGSDRAEDLSSAQVLNLFAGSGGDDEIVERLMAPGVYLLQGSRGTGKTMMLRVAYERLKAGAGDVLPVFVSFARYLTTYSSTAKASSGYSPFQHWVFARLLYSLIEEAQRRHPKATISLPTAVPLKRYADRLETHYADESVSDPCANAAILGVSEQTLREFARLDQVQSKILGIIAAFGFKSVMFFLDEAAQNFAEDLQPQFFQLLRHLRHHSIAVKAAVYPNTTNYGRDFDIGQDAIVLNIERRIENSEGMEMFRELANKRLAGTNLKTALDKSELQRDFLIKMSGGNPRWFIHLLNHLNHTTDRPITTTSVVQVAKEFPDNTIWPYLQNLRKNLSSKRKYVDTAIQLESILIDGLVEINKGVRVSEKSVCYVAISTHKTLPFRVHAAIKLLQYAGILSARGPKKISRDTAEMYLIHPAILVRENALYPREATPSLQAWVSALNDPSRERFREFSRNNPRLLEFRQEDSVDGSLCETCSSLVTDGARFCSQCGTAVSKSSLYEELLSQPVNQLELTPGIKRRLMEDGRFKTIGDIANASDSALDDIHFIGDGRIPLIRYAVDEFLAG